MGPRAPSPSLGLGKGRFESRPSRDIDILFSPPPDVYWRFQAGQRIGNRSCFRRVKYALAQTYSHTTLRGGLQVVSAPFGSTPIEIRPGFRCRDGSIIICDTNGRGQYKTSTAEAEAYELDASDRTWNGNTRALTRMMKQWQRERNVPLKSFQIERLAVEFLRFWPLRFLLVRLDDTRLSRLSDQPGQQLSFHAAAARVHLLSVVNGSAAR